MANVDNPYGFRFDVSYSDEVPAVRDFEMAESTTLSQGDPVTISGGYVTKAVTSNAVLGVFLGPAAVDDSVYDGDSITSGAGENPVVKVLVAFADTIFRVQDVAAAPAITARGTKVDFVGATGAVEINSGVTTNGDCLVVDVAEQDNIAGNELGANVDWLISFANRVFM